MRSITSRTAPRVVAFLCAAATAGLCGAIPAQAATTSPDDLTAAIVAAGSARASDAPAHRAGTASPAVASALAKKAFGASAEAVTLAASSTEVHRSAGADRWETAVAVSQTYGLGDGGAVGSKMNGVIDADETAAPVVYVANGMSYADALSAAPAAAFNGGPLLLTPANAVPMVVLGEIARLHPAKIVVVGGTASVSDAAYKQLAAIQPKIRRDAGPDRYATSRAVVKNGFDYAAKKKQPTGIAFIATGTGYADALASSAAAATLDSPVILVNGSASSMDAATTTFLRTTFPVQYLLLAGGTASLSAGFEKDVYAKDWDAENDVVRLAGSDRFATANTVNATIFGELATGSVWVPKAANYVSGLNFPDALSAGAVAGAFGEPLYLARQTCIPAQAVKDPRSWGVSTFWIIGGTSVLGPAVDKLTTC